MIEQKSQHAWNMDRLIGKLLTRQDNLPPLLDPQMVQLLGTQWDKLKQRDIGV